MPLALSGSLVLSGSISTTGAITMSGSIASASYAALATTASNANTSSYVVSSVTDTTQNSRLASNEAKTGSFATTGSNAFTGSQSVSGSLTLTGTITAQTLVVQTITSSVEYSSGSNVFGSNTGNTHQFTGSVLVSGSQTVNGIVNFNSGTGATSTNFYNNGDFISNWIGNSTLQLFSIRNNSSTGVFLNTQNSAPLRLGVSTGTTGGTVVNHFEIASTGAATFSSSVMAAGLSSVIAKGGSGVESTNLLNLRATGTGAIGDSLNLRFLNTDGAHIANISGILGADNVAYGSLAFSTRNYNTDSMVEVIRINNRGNVIIGGTVAQNNATNRGNLTINGTTAVLNLSVSDTNCGYLFHNGTDLLLVNAKNGSSLFYTNDTERMRITSGGNVGIGTTAPTTYSLAGRHLELNDAGGGYAFYHCNTTTVKSFYASNESALLTALFTFSNHPLTFGTNNTERMRITSGGYLKASNNSSYYSTSANYHEFNSNYADSSLLIRNTNATPYGLWVLYNGASPNSTNSEFIYCSDTTNSKFIVWSSGTAVNRTGVYGTISDISLKENIINASPKLEDLSKLKVRNFNFIGEDLKQIGFVAQEIEEIFPNMVDTDKKGIKSVKTTVLIPMLVKAVQELSAENDTLKEILQRNNIQ